MGYMHRFILTMLGLCAALVLTGCAGNLSDPAAFADGGVELKDAETILAESCGTTGCHDDSPQAQQGLDLLSPGVENRVVDVNAVATGCTDRILVIAGDPDNSYLISKLGAVEICGTQMPLLQSLPQDEIDTLRQWVIDLGDSSGTPDGG